MQPQVVSAGIRAICQARQLMPYYYRIAAPADYYAILSAIPKKGIK
jgi:hypothetical protein